ncbi:MAG: hypothetical protein E6G97_17805 [Alphaproteobacteria bacterium]|jgi:hypothetical protein|nr:MAG: hypothetical protein E6G97_17805 [Alphaproteobacteria bacterium]
MAIRYVEDSYKSEGPVCHLSLEADKRSELVEGGAARMMAMEVARKHNFPVAGHSSLPTPYPVNAQGEMSQGIVNGTEKVAAYRINYTLHAGLFGGR